MTGLSKLESRPFTVPQSTDAGPASDGAAAALDISDLTGAYVMVQSSGTVSAGTISVEYSADGVKWTVSGTPIQDGSNKLEGIEVLARDFPYVRVRCTETIAGAAGVVAASVIGRKAWRPS
jgi:hypothetical protein